MSRHRGKGSPCDFCGQEVSEEHSLVQREFEDVGLLTFHWDCLWAVARLWKQKHNK